MRILIVLFVVLSFTCNASNEERVAFGLTLLEENFNKFEARHSACTDLSKDNRLSEESIKILKKLPITVGESLGFLNAKAVRKCSSPEYNEVLRILLSVESANKKVNNDAVNEKIETLKLLMFPVTELNLEKKYFELPKSTKEKLLSIKEFHRPFNMVDGFERAWLN